MAASEFLSNILDIWQGSECTSKIFIIHIAQKIKFFIKDFFSKCDQIRSFLRIWLYLLKKSLIENFIFCGV